VDRRNSDVTFVDPQRLGFLRRRVLHLVDLFKFRINLIFHDYKS
jgi:hypothetical protein